MSLFPRQPGGVSYVLAAVLALTCANLSTAADQQPATQTPSTSEETANSGEAAPTREPATTEEGAAKPGEPGEPVEEAVIEDLPIRGDVNGDGQVTTADLRVLQIVLFNPDKFAEGYPADIRNAVLERSDLNRDGQLTHVDAELLQQHLAALKPQTAPAPGSNPTPGTPPGSDPGPLSELEVFSNIQPESTTTTTTETTASSTTSSPRVPHTRPDGGIRPRNGSGTVSGGGGTASGSSGGGSSTSGGGSSGGGGGSAYQDRAPISGDSTSATSNTQIGHTESATSQEENAEMLPSSLGISNAPELAKPDSATAPIVHRQYFQGERELFGYAPWHVPNSITFDPRNKPFIRSGTVVQTVGDDTWMDIDLRTAVLTAAKAAGRPTDGILNTGTHQDWRVSFDQAGNAFTIVSYLHSSGRFNFLAVSRDNGRRWQAQILPQGVCRLEFQDGNNEITTPPLVLVCNDGRLDLIFPEVDSLGRIRYRMKVHLSDQADLVENHSGAGNSVVRHGDLAYAVWPEPDETPSGGTKQIFAAVDCETGEVLDQRSLGTVGDAHDNHRIPAITVDSIGGLHVVFGVHHEPLSYLRSKGPWDTGKTWHDPINIGEPSTSDDTGRYTYMALLCDENDQLHLVTRWVDQRYRFNLVYLRGNAQRGDWNDPVLLLRPFRSMYSIWYHNLNIDRKGRLFLSYRYYGNQYSREECKAYEEKWPQEKLVKVKDPAPPRWFENSQAHDPAILISDDGGGSWRLMVSRDVGVLDNPNTASAD